MKKFYPLFLWRFSCPSVSPLLLGTPRTHILSCLKIAPELSDALFVFFPSFLFLDSFYHCIFKFIFYVSVSNLVLFPSVYFLFQTFFSSLKVLLGSMCLVISYWIPDIVNFTFFGAGYFYYLLNILELCSYPFYKWGNRHKEVKNI